MFQVAEYAVGFEDAEDFFVQGKLSIVAQMMNGKARHNRIESADIGEGVV